MILGGGGVDGGRFVICVGGDGGSERRLPAHARESGVVVVEVEDATAALVVVVRHPVLCGLRPLEQPLKLSR